MTSDGDRDIAAVLLLAVENAGLPHEHVAARIEAELLARNDVEPWLAQAALAKSPDGIVSVLRAVAGAHPLLSDALAAFEVIARVRERHHVPPARAIRFVLDRWYDGDVPPYLTPLMDDVYEDGFCAHEWDEVQPELAARALDRFLMAARGRSQLAEQIARVAGAGWV